MKKIVVSGFRTAMLDRAVETKAVIGPGVSDRTVVMTKKNTGSPDVINGQIA